MDSDFERIQQVQKGKEIFGKLFKIEDLSIDDTFLLILTNDDRCIGYGIQYLPEFIEYYHKRHVYVMLDKMQYAECFSDVGGGVRYCESDKLKCLAAYLDLFHNQGSLGAQIIFLTEKDEYNWFVETLLEEKSFSLEEYVAISLYQLRGLKERI